jgi:hypothetical protein
MRERLAATAINRIASLNVPTMLTQLVETGFKAFVLPGHGVEDRASFFEAIRSSIPLDPPLASSNSWDALSDSLWQGLYCHPAKRIAILWPNADAMATSSASEFSIALAILEDVAISLSDVSLTRGSPKEVSILVECRVTRSDIVP